MSRAVWFAAAALVCADIGPTGIFSAVGRGTVPDGAAWKMDVPPEWNGTLLIFSHGYGGGPDTPFRTAPGGHRPYGVLTRFRDFGREPLAGARGSEWRLNVCKSLRSRDREGAVVQRRVSRNRVSTRPYVRPVRR